MLFSLVALLAAAASVQAHGGVTSLIIGGTTYPGWSPYNDPSNQTSAERPYSSYNPITSVSDPTFSCNDNGLASGHQLSLTVAAGTAITGVWTQWTHLPGPVIVYMASCGGACTSANSDSLNWFKIQSTGLISGTVGNGSWGCGQVLNTLQYTATVPASLAAGEYLIRYELIALHQANAPQFYPECIQLIVTGGGGQTPGSSYLVKFPGGYSATDPSININIYDATTAAATSYAVPGPPQWPGGSSTSSSSTTKSTTSSTSTSTTKSTSSSSSTTSTAPVTTQTKYGQCGGTGWTGPTVCASGSTCTYSSAYYSQCL